MEKGKNEQMFQDEDMSVLDYKYPEEDMGELEEGDND